MTPRANGLKIEPKTENVEQAKQKSSSWEWPWAWESQCVLSWPNEFFRGVLFTSVSVFTLIIRITIWNVRFFFVVWLVCLFRIVRLIHSMKSERLYCTFRTLFRWVGSKIIVIVSLFVSGCLTHHSNEPTQSQIYEWKTKSETETNAHYNNFDSEYVNWMKKKKTTEKNLPSLPPLPLPCEPSSRKSEKWNNRAQLDYRWFRFILL